MLNLIKKTTLATFSVIALVGGLSAQAHAMEATLSTANITAQTQHTSGNDVLFKNDSTLQTRRLQGNNFSNRSLNNQGLNSLRSNDRDYSKPNLNNRIFNNSNSPSNFGRPSFGSTVSNHNNFGTNGLGNSQFGHDSFNQDRFSKRDISGTDRFKSHVNSNQNFRDATILRSRF